MNKEYCIAVVGALGAVGSEMIRKLEESSLLIKKLVPLDVKEAVGKEVTFRSSSYKVSEAKAGAFKGVDFAIFSAGAEASSILAPIAVKEGAVVVDNSSQWRMDPSVPLVIPEVNPDSLKDHKGIIANPNCSTIQMLVALKPIHDTYSIKRIVVATYQAVSGSGNAAIRELHDQSKDVLEKRETTSHVYPHQIAFNVIPQIDIFLENGYTKEEMKMVHETHKILDKNILVSPTAVRVPVVRSHSEAIMLELNNPYELHEVRDILSSAQGVVVVDNVDTLSYPMPIDAQGKNEVFVGRIRRDESVVNGLSLFVVSDNLLKGAALNAVQIVEKMVEMKIPLL